MENNLAAAQPEQSTAAPTTADSAPASTDEGNTSAPAPVEKPKGEPKTEQEPEWFRKRFDEITARYRETERRALAAESELSRMRQQPAQPVATEKPKTLADFEYDEAKYQEYVMSRVEKVAENAADKRDRERKTAAENERRQRKFQEREIAFEREAKDYRDVAHCAPISNDVAEIILDLETGPEVAYYLGKNRDIALTLNDLPKHIAAVELGRIDAKLSAERKAKAEALEKAKAEKAVSKAPAPTPSIDGSGEPGHVKPDEPDSDKLSDAEWARRRNKQLAKKRS